MLLVPVYREIDWRRPPLVTFALVLLNVLFFFGVQGHDARIEKEAFEYYFNSPLSKIEIPAYVKHLQNRGDADKAAQIQTLAKDPRRRAYAVFAMEADHEFMKRLRSDLVVTRADAQYDEWHDARAHFESILHEISAYAYGFTPAEHRLSTFLSHMFMHGGFGHLLGNMIFLLLIGFTVEAVLGGTLYLGLYLALGIAAVLLFWLAYPASEVPLVGASGAIAGLMGLYTVLFGKRRIKFFYSILFYFNFIRAPALLLLPLWLINEAYQLFGGGPSNVAYVAHIGGLVAGGAAGFVLIKRFPRLMDTTYMDKTEKEEHYVDELAAGMRHMAALDLDRAKAAFAGILQREPDNRAALVQLFHIAKFRPDTEDYHALAARVLALKGGDDGTLKLVGDAFRDYTRRARPVRLSRAQFLTLAQRFAGSDYSEDAEKIVNLLLRIDKQGKQLGPVLFALAEGFARRKEAGKYERYLNLLIETFPQSTEATRARQLMAAKKVFQ